MWSHEKLFGRGTWRFRRYSFLMICLAAILFGALFWILFLIGDFLGWGFSRYTPRYIEMDDVSPLGFRLKKGQEQLIKLLERPTIGNPDLPEFYVEVGKRGENGQLVDLNANDSFVPTPHNPLYCDQLLYTQHSYDDTEPLRQYKYFHSAYARKWKDHGACFVYVRNRPKKRGIPKVILIRYGRYHAALIFLNWIASGALRKTQALNHPIDLNSEVPGFSAMDPNLSVDDINQKYEHFLIEHAQLHFGLPDAFFKISPTFHYTDDDCWYTNKFIPPSALDEWLWNAAENSDTVWSLVKDEPKYEVPLLNFKALGQSDIALDSCVTRHRYSPDIKKKCHMNDYALKYVTNALQIQASSSPTLLSNSSLKKKHRNNHEVLKYRAAPVFALAPDGCSFSAWGLNSGSLWYSGTETNASLIMSMYYPERIHLEMKGDQILLNNMIMELFSFPYAEPNGLYAMIPRTYKRWFICKTNYRTASFLARKNPGLNSTMFRGGPSETLALFKHGVSPRLPGAYPGGTSDKSLRDPRYNASEFWEIIRNQRISGGENLTKLDAYSPTNPHTGLKEASYGGFVPNVVVAPSHWLSGIVRASKQYAWHSGDYSLHTYGVVSGPDADIRVEMDPYIVKPAELGEDWLLGEPLMNRSNVLSAHPKLKARHDALMAKFGGKRI